MAVKFIELPRDVYQDALETFLLLDCLRTLYHDESGGTLPKPLGLMSRNDLLLMAQQALSPETRSKLSAYADSIDRDVAAKMHPALPLPVHGHDCQTSAEILARRFLDGGNAPLWSATRQVLLALEHERKVIRLGCSTLLLSTCGGAS